jgi:hypothetical protein
MCHPARKRGGKGIAVLKRKFFNNNYLSAQGGLEPAFQGSSFRYFPWCFPENFHQGGKLRNRAETKL